ncbi:MAG: Gfo/Idh/MocA family oxidoreductase, partial [Gemmatimonas sp.]
MSNGVAGAGATPKQQLRLLFLGCGYATRIHSGVLKKMRDVEMVYASRDAARAAEYCAKYGGVASYGSYELALADASVDVALVATPTSTHAELTLMALAAGKHVIVEKPAFMSSADTARVREAARAAGRLVFVAENYVYKPLAYELRDKIGSGALGDVRFVLVNATKEQNAEGWRAEPSLSGGGALFEAGIHWISFMTHLGLDVVRVEGIRVGSSAGADRSSVVLFRYGNGAGGTLSHSWELRAPFGGARASKIQGTRGT